MENQSVGIGHDGEYFRENLTVPFAFAGVLGTVSFDGGKCDVKTICGSLDGMLP
ncbi:MAG: hypothetical protein IJX93_08475 [Clostridia bacterium]|nr:hypothetical protein [Clostridia bacterium]